MLSIIIPTYNEENYLGSLLETIQRQTVQPDEIVVADAHSTDGTTAIARMFGCTVVSGGNPATGRNNGAEVARGELLLFLDADVLLDTPHFLERMLSEFEARELDIATCKTQPRSKKLIDFLFWNIYDLYTITMQHISPHASGFFILTRKELHDQVAGFDEEIMIGEDHEYTQRISEHGSYGILKSVEILVSSRRFERDGHWKTAAKYIFTEASMLTKGPIKETKLFDYDWSGYRKK